MKFGKKNPRCRRAKGLAFAALFAAGWIGFAIAEKTVADDQPGATNTTGNAKDSLDEELLKGLSNDLLDGADDLPKLKSAEKTASATRPSGDAPKPAKKVVEKGQPSTDGEGPGQPNEDRDPLAGISRQMRDVQRRISSSQSGDETQRKQQAISDQLAKLIEQLKKADQSSSKQGGSNSSSLQRSKAAQAGQKAGNPQTSDKPAKNSSNQTRREGAAKADPTAIRERMKEAWGNLPERIREQMMQSSVDEFLPKYELLIEKYFQRLSEDETPNP